MNFLLVSGGSRNRGGDGPIGDAVPGMLGGKYGSSCTWLGDLIQVGSDSPSERCLFEHVVVFGSIHREGEGTIEVVLCLLRYQILLA